VADQQTTPSAGPQRQAASAAVRAVTPTPRRARLRFKPDPELLGSAEGNNREVKKAKAELWDELGRTRIRG
jgi:hypothetical protein